MVYDPGQNYIINRERVIPANSIDTFQFDLTGISGRVRITGTTFQANMSPRNAPFDLLLTQIQVERFDATRPEEILIDGTPSVHEILGPHAGLVYILSAQEVLLARSRILLAFQNTTGQPIRLSATLHGHTTFDDRDDLHQRSATTRT